MALKPGPFVDSLCRHQPASMDELRARAAGYIQMEEHAEFCNNIRDGLAVKGESSSKEKQKSHFDQRSKRPRQARGPRLVTLANMSNVVKLPAGGSEDAAEGEDDIQTDIKDAPKVTKADLSKVTINKHPYTKKTNPVKTVPIHSTGTNPLPTITCEESLIPLRGGFAGGGSSNSARKWHLRNVHNINDHHNSDIKTSPSTPPIVFTDDDYEGISLNQDDPMVISVEVANWEVQKTLIDQGSSADVLYWPTFLKLDIPHNMIQPYSEPLVGFAGERVHTRGFIELLTSFGTTQNSKRVLVKYLLVDAVTSYNIFIGRPTLNQLGAIVSTPHLTMKFPGTDGRIITIKANQQIARRCYAESLRIAPTSLQPEKSNSSVVAHLGTREMADLDP
ncbi:uncharacterized protein LOC109796532 [Cajanus cajan]|uniref:uncharacterized protein LOC109796532 n=1 Tax=Cajanus cajan TaxID=3821 RepID=UPI00098DA543|nr:uncharacterized protein LOC109796532 [Cajanus cajan]